MAVKLLDEVRSGINVVVEDSELKVVLDPATKYRVHGLVYFVSPNLEDFKFRLVGPDSPEFYYLHLTGRGGGYPGLSCYRVDYSPSGQDIGLAGATSPGGVGSVEIQGLITTGDVGGDLKFLWSQYVAGSAITTVKAGSFLEAVQVF